MATETPTESTGRGENFYLHALLGAVVTVVVSFIPLSPILGGGVASYLHDAGSDRGIRIGAVAGIIATVPLVAIYVLLFSVMSIGSLTTGEFAGPVFVIVLVGVIFLVAALITVGLSALGGYLGAEFAASRRDRSDATSADDRVPAGPESDETVSDTEQR